MAAGIVNALAVDLHAFARRDVAPRDEDVVVRVQQQQRRQFAGSVLAWSWFPWRWGRCSLGRGGRRVLGGIVLEFLFELERLVFDVAILDLEFAALQPGIAHERVPVVAALELGIEVEQAGAQVEEVDARMM